MSAYPQLFCSVLFRPWKYFTRFRSKFLMSWTARLRSPENNFTKVQASGLKRLAALIKAIFPDRSLLVSSLEMALLKSGFPKCVISKWFKPTSKTACILITNAQSLSRSSDRIRSRDIPTDSVSQSKNNVSKSSHLSGKGMSLPMPFMAIVLLAPVLPLRFPLLNLSVRHGNDTRCQPFETLEWSFVFWWFRLLHIATVPFHDLERNILEKRLRFRFSCPNEFLS